MPLLIRPATPADVPMLLSIRSSVRENCHSRNPLDALGMKVGHLATLIQSGSGTWIAQRYDQAIGFAMADAAEASLSALFVRPEHEGLGVGSRLLTQAERWLFQYATTIWLETSASNRAYAFFLARGWIPGHAAHKSGNVELLKHSPTTSPA